MSGRFVTVWVGMVHGQQRCPGHVGSHSYKPAQKRLDPMVVKRELAAPSPEPPGDDY